MIRQSSNSDELNEFFRFLAEQQKELHSLIDLSQDSDEEFSPEFMLSNIEDEQMKM